MYRTATTPPFRIMGRLLKAGVTVLLPALFLLMAGVVPSWAATLTVDVHGKMKPDGAIRIALYDKADGFRHEASAVAVLSAKPDGGHASAVFDNLKPGRYAVIAYQDENGNRKLDLFMGMFPEESWGLSQDPTVMGPPSFDASAFNVADGSQTIGIRLRD